MHLPPGILALCFTLLLGLLPLVGGAATNTTRAIVTPGGSHSLTESYQFDPRDGWEPVMVTNLRYKYRRSPIPRMTSATTLGKNSSSALERPSSTNTNHFSTKSVLRSVKKSLTKFTKGILPMGKAESVIITWYTGHDLLNPSCWVEPKWAPTDKSFVAALTEDGWSKKPQCLEFLELCRNPTACVFVRVVDSCAGCEVGSKHVDLTQAAFKLLAPLDEGVLTVQMRQASNPTNWNEELWGPKDE